MLRLVRAIKYGLAVASATLMLAAASSPSHAQTGSVHLHIVKVGFIVGIGGGHGTLTYQGHRYRLSLGGVHAGTIGISGATLVGTASNLYRPEDIAGTYGAAAAGAAFVGGAKVATLQNEKGVVLQVHGVQMGFDVTLGLGGMTIALR